MLWSVVSKAAKQSRRQRHDNLCDPMALIWWSWIYSRAFQWSDACSRQTDKDWEDH